MTQCNNFDIVNVGELFTRAATLFSKRLAIISNDKSLTYQALEQRSNQLANVLLAFGLQRRDRVAVYLENCPEIVELELACYKTALVKVPINARLSATEVARMLEDSGASLLITTRQRAEECLPYIKEPQNLKLIFIDSSPEEQQYDYLLSKAKSDFKPVQVTHSDLAVLHYTSGSSGVLKAAMQTFGNRLAQLRKFLMRPEKVQIGERLGLVGPITHASGMQLMPAFMSGATVRLFNRFKPDQFLYDMYQERIQHTFLVPTMINLLLEELHGKYLPLPDLKRLSYGAAPMAPARIMQAMDVFGPVLSQGYGAGETTSAICSLTIKDHLEARAINPERLASCGRPFLESNVRIVDEQGQAVALGDVGEIVVAGDDVFAGYWQAPELSQEVLINDNYHTGDLAVRDEEGFIYIVDRKKDMIISGGFNVYPSEVEAVIYQHPDVKEVCVFAVPDDKWGESVAAHVVLKPSATINSDALEEFFKKELTGYKRPRKIKLVDELIKNPNGKIVRKKIQEPYWADYQKKVN